MVHENNIGYKIRLIHNQIHKRMETKRRENEGNLTGMQHWTIRFLDEHRKEDVYQKDIERAFSISRATASNMLQVMERENLILREPVTHDARLKKLVMTEKSEQMLERAEQDIYETEALLTRGMKPEEIAQLHELLNRMLQNIGE